MDRIKVLCLATHIMEITRMLPNERKQKLEKYCDKVMLNEHTPEKLEAYKIKRIDLASVRRVSNLEFRP